VSETISPTFTFVKDGVFYFSRRIPKELRRHYTSPRIAYSLRTRSAKVADARARKAADQLDEYWFHLRSKEAQFPGKHMLRISRSADGGTSLPQPVSVSSFVMLSEAVTLYLDQKRGGVVPPPSRGPLRGRVRTSSTHVATNTSTSTPRPTPTPSVTL